MRILLNIVGVVLVFFGGVWFLQGINVLPGSFMTGQIKWAVYGGIAFVAGVIVFIWANRKKKVAGSERPRTAGVVRESPEGPRATRRFARPSKPASLAEIHHVDVGAQPDVIGEIPANVIRVFIDYDLIGVPVPAIAVTDVVRSHTKIETAKPEAAWSASR